MLISPEVKSPEVEVVNTRIGAPEKQPELPASRGHRSGPGAEGRALDWCQGQSPPSKRRAVPKDISDLPSPHLPGRASSR